MAGAGPDGGGSPTFLFCSTCGHPMGDHELAPARRVDDWYGVRLRLSERFFVGALVVAANAASALAALALR